MDETKQLEIEAVDDYQRHLALEEAAMSNPYSAEDLAAGFEEANQAREVAIKAARDKLYNSVHQMGHIVSTLGYNHPDYDAALDALQELDSFGVL